MTSNGVVHVIDAVLVPPSIDVAAFMETCTDSDPESDEESSSSSLYGSIVGLTIIAGVSALFL